MAGPALPCSYPHTLKQVQLQLLQCAGPLPTTPLLQLAGDRVSFPALLLQGMTLLHCPGDWWVSSAQPSDINMAPAGAAQITDIHMDFDGNRPLLQSHRPRHEHSMAAQAWAPVLPLFPVPTSFHFSFYSISSPLIGSSLVPEVSEYVGLSQTCYAPSLHYGIGQRLSQEWSVPSPGLHNTGLVVISG